MFIPYIKETGEIVTPVIGSSEAQDFNTVFGKNAEVYSQIYDSINLKDDPFVIMNIAQFKIDTSKTPVELVILPTINKYTMANNQ